MPFELSAPRRVGPHSHGLLSTLGTKPLPDRITPEEGVTWVLESCEDLDTYDVSACPTVAILKPTPNRAIRGFQDPPVVPRGAYIALECATVDNSQEKINAQALDVYARNIEFFIAQSFVADLAVDPNLVPQGAATASCALALGQSLIADLSGRGSIIFAPSAVISVWSEGGGIRQDDEGNLRTSLGNLIIVIPDASQSQPFTVYFADSIPDIYISEPQLLNDEASFRLRRDNTFLGIVESQFVITFDPCLLASYDVDLGC